MTNQDTFSQQMLKGFWLLVVLAAAAMNQGCTEKTVVMSSQAPSAPSTAVTTVSATLSECPNGGTAIATFLDKNLNGVMDAGEEILSKQLVCNGGQGSQGNNGQNGINGINGVNGAAGAGIGLIQIVASSAQCPTGGKVYTYFLDKDNDGDLDNEDSVIATQIVCNGLNGTNGTNGNNGTNGSNGTNGHSAAFSQASADHTSCANGGIVVNMGVDLNNNGLLDTSEIKQVAVVCNGNTGQKGDTGATGQTGPTGYTPEFAPVMPITPCSASSSQYKEVLLGLEGGQILSEFSGSPTNADLVRNTFIPDGSYFDTDNSQCYFTVSTYSNGNRIVSWDGSSANGSGPYHAGNASYNASTGNWTATY
jgi:hypothetical protein